MANKTILFNIDIESSNYVKKVREAEINVANLKNKQQELNDSLQSIGDQFGYNSEQYESATTQLKAYDAAIKVATKDVTNANKQLEDQVRFNNAAEGSYEQLYRQWKNAEIALKTQAGNMRQLADGTFELTEQGKKATAEVLRLKEGVLTFNASIKDGRLNVGNYSQALNDYFGKLQQATGGTSSFSQAIGGIRDAITNTSTGFQLLKDGVSGIKDGLKTAQDSFSNFFSVTSKGDTFSTFNDSASEAAENITEIGSTGVDAGKKLQVGTNLGANGFKILRAALISTGIGAIVVAVGSLLGYLSTLQSVTDKVKAVFSALSAVFKVYLKTVFDVIKAIATLDFSGAISSLSGFAGEAGNAAKEAYDLEEAKIALEEADIRNIALQDELNDKAEKARILSEDKTKSDEERIAFMQEAAEAEKQVLQLQLEREQQALALAKRELDTAEKVGEATREQRKAYEELKVKVGDIQDEIANKEIQTLAETSKLRKNLAADRLNTEVTLLNNQLKLAQLGGSKAFGLQRKLAKQQLDAEIQAAGDDANAKLIAQSNYNVKIAEINKSAGDARIEREKELQQLSIDNIVDGQAREIAAVAFATDQKLKAIEKGTAQERLLKLKIAEDGAKETLAIAQKYSQLSQQERQTILQSNLEIQQTEIDSEALKQQQILELQISAIDAKETKTQEDLEFQKNASQQSLRIEEERLKKQLDLQLNATGQRIAADKAFYDNATLENNKLYDDLEKKTRESGLSREKIDIELANLANQRRDSQALIDKQRLDAEVKTEQETGAKITEITNAINANRIQQTVTTNKTIAESNAKLIEEQNALTDAVNETILEGLGAISEALGSSEKNQKKYALLNKSIALTELVINLQREISGYWAGVAKDTATGGFILGTASSAKATAQTIAASIRAATGIAKISAQKFETGGFTVGDAVKRYNPTIAPAFSGGFVSSPTMWPGFGKMNLAGEAGTEYVSPSWQLKQAPQLFSALESWRRTGVKPFADGGFTTTTITQPLQQNAELIESAIMRGFMAAPAPVVSVQEINDTQSRISLIESRSSL